MKALLMSAVSIPVQFDFLQPFAATWGNLRTQNELYLKRQELPYAELEIRWQEIPEFR